MTSRLEQQIQTYEQWKTQLVQTIDGYRKWLTRYHLATDASEKLIEESLAALQSERLTITFIAEFSRGKTELINAIFFANYGKRLLPSAAGRTTMCPTEIFYDNEADQAYVRLLPIETRLSEMSLHDLRKQPDRWVTYPLDPDSVTQMEHTLREVVQTRRVPITDAKRLGLYDPDLHENHNTTPTHVDIPKWRHALISFPHPLLKQGLAILDTPGLNALGSEPELTLSMLPASQAILFVLAADTGVTKSDLDMWRHHIKGFHSKRKQGLMVVLNKIDTLWDELSNDLKISEMVKKQRRNTADILGIEETAVFPVSAQKGLLAKVRNDNKLLERSRLRTLEDYLSRDILDSRQRIVQDTIIAGVSNMVENSYGVVASKLNRIKSQQDELRQISGKSQDVIEHMMQEARTGQEAYLKNVASFQTSHKVLVQQMRQLRHTFDQRAMQGRLEEMREKMAGNWTTLGLRNNMRRLFEELRGQMQEVVDKSEQTRKLIRSIYRHFQSEHNFSVAQPKMLSVMRYRVALEMLYQEAETFRKSPVMAITEKHFVVRRFFNALVGEARKIFDEAAEEVDTWTRSALDPLIHQIKDHKEHIEQHLQDLQRISRSRDTLKVRMKELQKQYSAISRQLTALRNMHNSLNDAFTISERERPKPRLVHKRDAS